MSAQEAQATHSAARSRGPVLLVLLVGFLCILFMVVDTPPVGPPTEGAATAAGEPRVSRGRDVDGETGAGESVGDSERVSQNAFCGKVVDAESAQALAGAVVRYVSRDGDTAERCISALAGEFALARWEASGSVLVEREGYITARFKLAQWPATLSLDRCKLISVRLDPQVGGRVEYAFGNADEPRFASAGNGVAILEMSTNSPLTLRAQGSGYVSPRLRRVDWRGLHELVLPMARLCDVAVTAVDEHNSRIVGAEIVLLGRRSQGLQQAAGARLELHAVTDENGQAHLENVEPGLYTAWLRSGRGHVATVRNIKIEQACDIVIRAAERMEVLGQVCDAEGRNCPNASVSFSYLNWPFADDRLPVGGSLGLATFKCDDFGRFCCKLSPIEVPIIFAAVAIDGKMGVESYLGYADRWVGKVAIDVGAPLRVGGELRGLQEQDRLVVLAGKRGEWRVPIRPTQNGQFEVAIPSSGKCKIINEGTGELLANNIRVVTAGAPVRLDIDVHAASGELLWLTDAEGKVVNPDFASFRELDRSLRPLLEEGGRILLPRWRGKNLVVEFGEHVQEFDSALKSHDIVLRLPIGASSAGWFCCTGRVPGGWPGEQGLPRFVGASDLEAEWAGSGFCVVGRRERGELPAVVIGGQSYALLGGPLALSYHEW